MLEIYRGFWNPATLEPGRAYLFGDNLLRRGKAGQACIRGCPNAFGVATKKLPSMNEQSFFTDDEYEENIRHIESDFENALAFGSVLVVSESGLGSGLAKLPTKAPKTYSFLIQQLRKIDPNYIDPAGMC